MTSIQTPAAAPEQGAHRALRLAIGAAAVVGLMLGVAQFSDIVGPFFLALNLMIVVWPVQRFLSRRVPRVIASILSGLLAIVIIGLFFWAIGWAASLFIQEIPLYKDQFQTMYDQALNLLAQYDITSSQIIDQLKSVNASSVVSLVGSLISNVSGVVSLLAVVISTLLFMIVDSVDFQARLERLGSKHNLNLVRALESFASGVRSYWVTSTVFGLVVSMLTWVGLAAYGIPLAIVWAVLSFVTNYIPNVGFIIGLIPAAVMGLLAKGPIGALYVIALFSLLNFVIQSVIQPKVTGDAVGVTSTVSFMSLLLWAVVLGPLGALLALPATLFVKALVVDADPRMRWLNVLIASNPKTSADDEVGGTADVTIGGTEPAVPVSTAIGVSTAESGTDAPRRAADVADPGDGEPQDDLVAVPRRSAVEMDDPGEPAPTHAVEESGPEPVETVRTGSTDSPGETTSEIPVVDAAAEVPADSGQQVEGDVSALAADGDVPPAVADAETATTTVADEADTPNETATADETVTEADDAVASPRRASGEVRDEPESDDTDSRSPLFQASATPYWTGAHAGD